MFAGIRQQPAGRVGEKEKRQEQQSLSRLGKRKITGELNKDGGTGEEGMDATIIIKDLSY